MNKNELLNLMVNIPCVFWDFDGVIKDSIEAKTNAFRFIFSNSKEGVIKKIISHHQENGGMSRYEKIPLYLQWSGLSYDTNNVENYCNKFSAFAKKMVIDSPWVDGARDFIEKRHNQGLLNIIVTATPQNEIEDIIDTLQIKKMFTGVYGSPLNKTNSLKFALAEKKIDYDKSIMVGDAKTDYGAARDNKVKFILRETEFNRNLQELCKGRIINNFIYE